MIGYVYNDAVVEIVANQTGWVSGQSNAVVIVEDVEEDDAYGNVSVRYPADYEVRFSDQVIDTSARATFFDVPTPVRFTTWNMTEDRKAHFIFEDKDRDSLISVGDRLVIVSGDSLGKPPQLGNYRAAWSMKFFQDTTQGALQPPGPGDVYQISTTKPFRTGEEFQFTMRAVAMDLQKAKRDLEKIAVVPNPYVGAASWEPPNLFRSGRGERRIFFIHLPAQCTISIYTVRGNLVQTLYHNSTLGDGQEPWNLVSKDGMDIAYGIYVYHVDAPGIGETIGKFAVVK
jgi:hypothetical protein